MAAEVVVDDPYEIFVLLRVLIRAKFLSEDWRELTGSPFMAKLCEKAVAALAAAQEAGRFTQQVGPVAEMYRGRPGDIERATVRRRVTQAAARRGNWSGWSAEQRAEYVRILLSPFTDESLVRELVEVEAEQTRLPDAAPTSQPDR